MWDATETCRCRSFFTYMFAHIILLCAYVEMNVMTVSQKKKHQWNYIISLLTEVQCIASAMCVSWCVLYQILASTQPILDESVVLMTNTCITHHLCPICPWHNPLDHPPVLLVLVKSPPDKRPGSAGAMCFAPQGVSCVPPASNANTLRYTHTHTHLPQHIARLDPIKYC